MFVLSRCHAESQRVWRQRLQNNDQDPSPWSPPPPPPLPIDHRFSSFPPHRFTLLKNVSILRLNSSIFCFRSRLSSTSPSPSFLPYPLPLSLSLTLSVSMVLFGSIFSLPSLTLLSSFTKGVARRGSQRSCDKFATSTVLTSLVCLSFSPRSSLFSPLVSFYHVLLRSFIVPIVLTSLPPSSLSSHPLHLHPHITFFFPHSQRQKSSLSRNKFLRPCSRT